MTKKVDGGGLRYNSHKAEHHQVPTSLTNAVAKTLMYGAQKYEKGNWRRGMKWSIVYDCLQRHMLKWLDGEVKDEESGLPHLYHAASNIAMLIEYAETCKSLDDRFDGMVNDYDTSFEAHSYNAYKPVLGGLTEEDIDDMSKIEHEKKLLDNKE